MTSQFEAASTASDIRQAVPQENRGRRRSSILAGRRGSRIALVQQSGNTGRPLTAVNLQDVIDDIGLGLFQVLAFVMFAGVMMSEGAMMLNVSALSTALQKDWGLTDVQTASLGSFSFAGLAIGTYMSGNLADIYGRRAAILSSYLCMSVSGGLVTMAAGFHSMAVLQTFSGLGAGLGVPAVMAIVSEITPSRSRPLMVSCIGSCFVLGELYLCSGLLIFMPDLENPVHWKKICIWASTPTTILMIVAVGMMHESAHWLAVQGRITEARVVLERMAFLNGRSSVLEKLGPSNETQETNEAETSNTSVQEIYGMLWTRESLFKITMFAILCVVGNMVSFGFGSFWPVALQRLSGENTGDLGSPAFQLALVRSVGLLSAVINALVSSSQLSHRFVIFSSGLLGSVAALFQIRFHSMLAWFLLLGMAANCCGNLQYTTSVIFLGESFATQVRSTAMAISITFGRLGSISTPLILQLGGQHAFLGTASLGFLAAALVGRTLLETKGMSLNDVTEHGGALVPNLVEVEDGVEAPGNLGDESDGADSEEYDPNLDEGSHRISTSLFAVGTVGARLELLFVAALFGMAPGSSVSFYLSSVGYFQALTGDKALFAVQLICCFTVSVPIMLLRRYIDPYFDNRFGVEVCTKARFCGSCFILSGLILATAIVELRASIAVLGVAIGSFAAIAFGSGMDLAVLANSASQAWQQAGVAVGAALPSMSIPLFGYAPGASLSVRIFYFQVPSIVCFGMGLLYLCYHKQFARILQLHNIAERSTRKVVKWEEDTLNAHADERSSQIHSMGKWRAWSNCSVCLGIASGFFLTALFPGSGSPDQAQILYIYKVTGDMIGRCSACLVWQGRNGAGVVTFLLLTILNLGRMAGAFGIADSIATTTQHQSNESFVWGIFATFAIGAFTSSGFEALGMCSVEASERRKALLWQNLSHFTGIVVGLLVGLLWLSHLPAATSVKLPNSANGTSTVNTLDPAAYSGTLNSSVSASLNSTWLSALEQHAATSHPSRWALIRRASSQVSISQDGEVF